MLDVIKFKYDLAVQEQVQSILSACIFYHLKELIVYNVEFKDLKHKPRCLSHLGKNGVCVTHADLSKYFCAEKKRIEYAMNPLKDLGLIGMDYFNTEMGSHPFYFLEKNGLALSKLDSKQERSCYKHVVSQTKCFNCAALYSHISYWNDTKKQTLIQSMQLIADCIGLTKEKVKLSIIKLSEFNLVHAITSMDRRYSLSIVGGGLLKVGGAPHQEMGEKWGEGLLKSDPASIYSYNSLQEKQGEEKTRPVFSQNEEKNQEILKFGHVEISNPSYNELMTQYGDKRVLYAINRYNREVEETGFIPKGKVKAHLLKYIGYALENEMKEESKRKAEKDSQEQEIKNQPKHVFVKSQWQIEAEKKKEDERNQGEEAIRRRIQERRMRLQEEDNKIINN